MAVALAVTATAVAVAVAVAVGVGIGVGTGVAARGVSGSIVVVILVVVLVVVLALVVLVCGSLGRPMLPHPETQAPAEITGHLRPVLQTAEAWEGRLPGAGAPIRHDRDSYWL